MKKIALILLSCCASIAAISQPEIKDNKILLPNGWTLTPVGQSLPLGDLPLNIAVSSTGKYLAITNNGVSEQNIELIDASNKKILNSIIIPESWLGLKFSKDEKNLYASAGNLNQIFKYGIRNDSLRLMDSIILGKSWPEKISPAGIEIDDNRQILYVVTKENNSLYVIDLRTKKTLKQVNLSAEAYTCLLSRDSKTLFVSLWGGSKVLLYNVEKSVIIDSIPVGRNPNDLSLTSNGKFLFVANAVDNSVSVIDVAQKKVIETLNAALYPDSPNGSTTNSVCLSNDNKTLYIANADNNCLTVFDVSIPGHSKSNGFIPTGWYPTCVRYVSHTLFVTNGKGFNSLPNPEGPQPIKKHIESAYKKADKRSSQYIGSLFKGTLSMIDEPDKKTLAIYSKQVYSNTPYNKYKEMQSVGEAGNPIPMKVGDPCPIKHIFYIIKENRTYDQVLGDETAGNGDTSLVLFGRKITPNEHKLAEEFVLLDNFYVDAEVSADGHNWSMAAYANDYVEKTWPISYGGRGGTYDYGGTRKIAYPRNGFIWDYALRAGLTIRNYGEFDEDDGVKKLKDLNSNTCHSYVGWNLTVQDKFREQVWEKDFDSLVAKSAVPQLNIIYLPNDHTSGLRKDAYTPYAHVADNDLAVGKLVEHLSQSPVWKNSVIFILEDDAQNGPDHVDAHRSIAFVAGPFVKHNYVDHSMYSTSGMLRTMELILGIPPMSQYDAAAVPMYKCFTSVNDVSIFKHVDATVDIDARNLSMNDLSRESETFNLADADEVPDLKFNQLLWKGLKGNNILYPYPKRSAFVALH